MRQLQISQKLLILVVVLSTLIAFAGMAGGIGMNMVYKNQNDITSRQVPAMNFLRAADIDLYQAMQSLYLMQHFPAISEAFLAELKNYEKNIGQADERFESYVGLMKDDAKEESVSSFRTEFTKWKGDAGQIIASLKNGSFKAETMDDIAESFDGLEELLDGIADNSMVDIEKNTTLSLSQFKNTTRILIALIIISIISAAYLGARLSRSILVPLQQIVAFANRVEKGNLSEKINIERSDEIGHLSHSIDAMVESLYTKAVLAEEIAGGNLAVDVKLTSEEDYLGQSLTRMVENLKNTISQIQRNSEEVTQRSASFSDASDSLSQGASQQAAALEEISSSLTEVDSETQQNITHAQEVNDLASSAFEAVRDGNSNMAEMMGAMEEISRSSQQIESVINVIDGIAFQTNLLALNAAVEAARAGTHGKGFAVVADEVRSLANRSSKAAKETADLIKSSVERVENGSQISTKTATSLELIESKINEITQLIHNIVTSSKKQGDGVKHVVLGLDQVESVTTQTAAHAEETAASANELAAFSRELLEVAAQFTLDTSKE